MRIQMAEHSEWVKKGKLFTFEMEMVPIPDRRKRTIRVWLPELYDGARRFPVLYLHDGQYVFPEGGGAPGFGSWRFDEQVCALPPECQCILVGIDTSGDRGSELLPPYKRNPAHRIPRDPGTPEYVALGHLYADFVRDTLKPVIDDNFLTLPDAEHTGVGGSSMGGLQSYYMTMKDPEVFGRSLDLSPGMDILDESCLALIDGYDAGRLEKARFYMYSGDQGVDVTIMTATLRVYRYMKEKLGLDYRHLCYVMNSRESHWGTSWSKVLPDGLRYLFMEDNSVEFPGPPPGRKT